MKKLLSVILSLLIVFSMVPVYVTTSAATTSDGLEYEIENGEVTITGYTGSAAEVVIPATIEGCPVTKIGDNAFYGSSSLISITIPDGVTNIGNYAFYGCSSLTSITIPNSVTSIGKGAFYWCESLTSITIPEGVTSIDDNAFSHCESLTSITIPEGVTSIGDEAFSYCRSLTSITIPDSVTSIGYHAFYGCDSLTSITIPDSVTSIGQSAFYATAYYNNTTNWDNGVLYIGNTLIEANTDISGNYVIEGGTRVIAESAFSDCSSLESITIPNSVTSISEYAFYYCTSLTSITIPDSVTSIGSYAFYECTSLSDVTIPDSVTSIGSYAFYECTSLSSVTISANVTNIDTRTFTGCINLTSVTIPDNVTSIGPSAFSGCSSLTSVIIPDKVSSIGSYAFNKCTSLVSVTIPDSVMDIGNNAFLNTVYYNNSDNWESDVLYINNHLIKAQSTVSGSYIIKDTTKSIADYSFEDCIYLNSITIPDNVTSIGDYAFNGCTGLSEIVIPDNITSIGSSVFYDTAHYNDYSNWENDVLYIGNHLIAAQVTIAGLYTIKEGTTSIADGSFLNCWSLESIIVPNSVTNIPDMTFCNCESLTSITIPSSVTSIGNNAFSSCSNIETVYYYGTEEQWNHIEIGGNNSYLTDANIIFAKEDIPEDLVYKIIDGKVTITDYSGSATVVVIPETIKGCPVTAIGIDAFYRKTTLVSITIPETVTYICDSAFYRCSSLETVYYGGTLETWESITVEDYNDELTEATLIFTRCISDGHSYDKACDTDCNVCGEVREITHDYADATCTSPKTCTVCGATEGSALGHSFDSIICTACGIVKDVEYTITDGCVTITKYTGNATELVIPSEIENCPVTAIGEEAFYRCSSLNSVTIPDTVSLIDAGAFDRCTSLETVYYKGTQDQWSAIEIGRYNESLPEATLVFTLCEANGHKFDSLYDMTCNVCKTTVEPTYDVNGDGTVNAMDAHKIKLTVISEAVIEPGTAEFSAADLNCDRKINIKDIYILRKIISLIY